MCRIAPNLGRTTYPVPPRKYRFSRLGELPTWIFVSDDGVDMLLPILEFIAAGLLVWFAMAQIVIPLLRGTPIFSALQRLGIEAKLQAARQELRIAELEREIAEIKRREQQVRLASLEDELGRFTEETPREAMEKGQRSVTTRRQQPERS